MLSGESVSHSDFSSSEEDEMNGTDLNRTLQGAASILQIKELIGRGAFGSVYKATWKGLPAAVKVGCHRKMGLAPPLSSIIALLNRQGQVGAKPYACMNHLPGCHELLMISMAWLQLRFMPAGHRA